MQTSTGRPRQSFSVMSAASRLVRVSFGVTLVLAISGVCAQVPAETCNEANKEIALSVSSSGQSVSFSCGTNFPTLKPAYAPAARTDGRKVCSDMECKNEGYLKALIQDATFVNASDRYTLTVTKLPKSKQVFYFLCSQPVSNGSSGSVPGTGVRRLSGNTSASCRVKVTVEGSSGNSATTATVARACLSVGLVIVGLVYYF